MLLHSTPPHSGWQPTPQIRRPGGEYPDDDFPFSDVDDVDNDGPAWPPGDDRAPERPVSIH